MKEEMKDMGASASQTGPSPSVEPVPVSPAVAASVPCAETNILTELWNAEQTAFQEMMGLPDWRYHDLPKLTVEDFDRFVSICGADNLRWITLADYRNWQGDGVDLRRGQVMISPEGQRRATEYASGIAARSDETPAAAQPEGQEPGPQGDAENA